LHPTHSVAALGDGAEEFVAGDEQFNTPIARGSSWGKLLDREAKTLLVGADLTRNTFIHGTEEWVAIPNRLTDHHEEFVTVLPDGTDIKVHYSQHFSNYSLYLWIVDKLLVG